MKKLICSLFLLLTGCASVYGNFSTAPINYQQQMAQDSVRQLVPLYPPAQTHFKVKATDDSYGKTLIQLLRLKGYAIVTVKQGANLHYIVDQSKNFYRVTLKINDQSLSCVYRINQNSQLYAAGPWSHYVG